MLGVTIKIFALSILAAHVACSGPENAELEKSQPENAILSGIPVVGTGQSILGSVAAIGSIFYAAEGKPSAPEIKEAVEDKRHVYEKKALLQRLDRKSGKWGSSHPRHRLLDALWGFARYRKRQAEELNRLKKLYKNIPKGHHKLLEKHLGYTNKFTNAEELLGQNQKLCDRIVDTALEFYDIDRSELEEHIAKLESDGKKADRVSVSQALKHIVRDWTEAGGTYEREEPFKCLLDTVQTLMSGKDNMPTKILLPGAGLGRLGHDIARLPNVEVTVNEWSMYMNVAYRFMEHYGHIKETESFHPFVDIWSHHAATADQYRQLAFPDEPPNASSVLMVEGDFTTVFNTNPAPQFDVIVTYFFIDTARNLVAYFDTIKRLLRPGGHWVNLGPLLYGTAPMVQLSLEEIVVIVEEGLGFEILGDIAGDECGSPTLPGGAVRGMEAAYGFNERALTRNAYQAQFWVARRP